MKRNIICTVAAITIIVLIAFIVRTNYLYGESLEPTQVSKDDYYEGDGYRIKVDKYEVLDREGLKEIFNDPEQFELYKELWGETGKTVLVYYSLQVTDVEAMDSEWWTNIHFEADIAWQNPADMITMQLIDGANVSKKNYEDGKAYKVILPYDINKLQVTDKNYDNAENWKYRVVWSQNPIFYTNLY